MFHRLPEKRILIWIDPPADVLVILPQIKVVPPEAVEIPLCTIKFVLILLQEGNIQAGFPCNNAI